MINGGYRKKIRIAFLCKRRYMSKDVILDRYARLYEIPYQLARLGHDVHGYCLSYQNAHRGSWDHHANPGQLTWESRPIWPDGFNYWQIMLRRLEEFHPDIIIGASDIPHVALAARLGKKLGIPYLLDLYDNFESFGQAKIPGMKMLLQQAVRDAPLVTTTSQALANYVTERYGAVGKIVSMPSTIDESKFRKLDCAECRRSLGLPLNAKLIGTAGGLLAKRGIAAVYMAWEKLVRSQPEIHLVLAGPVDPDCLPPKDGRVHYLGLLPHEKIPMLFNSLDIGIIYLRDTAFGRYCFPQKAYEMASCQIPIVAANVGAMAGLFIDCQEALYVPDSDDDLIRAINFQFINKNRCNFNIAGWPELTKKLEFLIKQAIN